MMLMELARLEVGELVWANVFNSLENSLARGKPRPAVLVAGLGGHWRTMCLTTNPHFADGSKRPSVPDYSAVGLQAPGFLWADHLTRVSSIDIGDHIGFADAALVQRVIDFAGLFGSWAADLRRSVELGGAE